MDNTIMVAIIGGLATAIPTLITSILTNRNNKDLIMFRISELEKKVDKHNNVIERMALDEKDITAVWRNIDELKKDVKK